MGLGLGLGLGVRFGVRSRSGVGVRVGVRVWVRVAAPLACAARFSSTDAGTEVARGLPPARMVGSETLVKVRWVGRRVNTSQ